MEPSLGTTRTANEQANTEDPAEGQSSAPPLPPPTNPRDAIARAKGMPGSTIVGGDDPDLETTVAAERRWIRLLIAMVVTLILAGFVLGALGAAVGGVVGP